MFNSQPVAIQPGTAPHLTLVSSQKVPERGVLLPVLRQPKWILAHQTLRRRLVPTEAAGDGCPGPWLTIGFDTSEFLDTLLETDDVASWPVLQDTAIQNLRKRSRHIQKLGPHLLSVTDEYAAEAILLVSDVARDLAQRLGCDTLAVSAAGPGTVLVGDLSDEMTLSVQVAWGESAFDARDGRRISRRPLIVRDGAVTGMVDPLSVPESTTRPWWQHW